MEVVIGAGHAVLPLVRDDKDEWLGEVSLTVVGRDGEHVTGAAQGLLDTGCGSWIQQQSPVGCSGRPW